jgi:hypothetical protein
METKTVKVGVVYQVKGYIEVEVPVNLKSNLAILDYVQDLEDHAGDLPLPTDPEYLDDSFEIDSIDGLCKEEIKCSFKRPTKV